MIAFLSGRNDLSVKSPKDSKVINFIETVKRIKECFVTPEEKALAFDIETAIKRSGKFPVPPDSISQSYYSDLHLSLIKQARVAEGWIQALGKIGKHADLLFKEEGPHRTFPKGDIIRTAYIMASDKIALSEDASLKEAAIVENIVASVMLTRNMGKTYREQVQAVRDAAQVEALTSGARGSGYY